MPTPRADGPDISHYQLLTGQAVPKTWRLFSHKATEGATSLDPMFARRWAWMREHGFRWRFAYHWLRSDSLIAVQAAHLCAVLDRLGGLQRGEAVQVDWERTSNIDVPTSLEEAEFRDRIEQHYGRACTATYVSDWMPDSTRDPDRIGEFVEWRQENPDAPLWYANYVTTPNGRQPPNADGWTECAAYRAALWQWTSSATDPSINSSSPGGTAGFDMNHVFDAEVLDRITDQIPPPAPTPVPPVITNPEVLPVEYFVRFKGFANVFHVGAGGAVHVNQAIVDKGRATLGDPIVVDHRETRVSVCAAAGIPEGFLTANTDGS